MRLVWSGGLSYQIHDHHSSVQAWYSYSLADSKPHQWGSLLQNGPPVHTCSMQCYSPNTRQSASYHTGCREDISNSSSNSGPFLKDLLNSGYSGPPLSVPYSGTKKISVHFFATLLGPPCLLEFPIQLRFCPDFCG